MYYAYISTRKIPSCSNIKIYECDGKEYVHNEILVCISLIVCGSQVLKYILCAWKIYKVMINIPLYDLYECHVLSRSFLSVDIYARSEIIDLDFVVLMSDNGIKICICPRLLLFIN